MMGKVLLSKKGNESLIYGEVFMGKAEEGPRAKKKPHLFEFENNVWAVLFSSVLAFLVVSRV